MKKICLLLITLSLFTAANAKGGFYFGPSVGMNVSTLTKQAYSKAVVKGNVGIMLGLNITNNFGIQAEALYSWQGSKISPDLGEFNLELDYIKVPILAKMRLIAGLNIEAGVSFDFLVHSNGNITNPKKTDISIPVGINYLLFDRLELGMRYYISTIRVPGLIDNPSKNSLFTVNARFRF